MNVKACTNKNRSVQACVLYNLFHGKIFLRVASFGFRFCQGKCTVFDQRVYITFYTIRYRCHSEIFGNFLF